MRNLLIVCIAISLLWSMGEKPQDKPSNKASSSEKMRLELKPKKVAMARNVVEKTPSKQFSKAYQEYLVAKKSNYEKYRELAIESFENYLKHFPNEDKTIDSIFYLEKLHLMNHNIAKQKQYIDKYFEIATTSNFYMKYVKLDNAVIALNSGEFERAKKDLEYLANKYSQEPYTKARAYINLETIYEREKNSNKLKTIYLYLLKHKDQIKNKNMFYIYNYRLANIYENQGDFESAKKYYSIVANAQDFKSRFTKQAAQEFLDNN